MPNHLKGAAMPRFRFFTVAAIYCFMLLFLNLPFSAGQDAVETPFYLDNEPINSYKIKVNVSEVRLDVVVVDGSGRPITDLTADDFEVYQDKRKQKITSGVYISDQAAPSATPSASRKKSPNPLQLPVPALKEEEVRRTIVFLVDDMSITTGDMPNAKRSISSFLEKQMQPGDMVAVMCTSYGTSAVDMFFSDKRLISARVNNLPAPQGDFYTGEDDPLYRVYESQIQSLAYSIHALKDMPGRKIVFFLTSKLTIRKPPPVVLSNAPPDYTEYYDRAFDRLADLAMRSGVVIHMLDAKGSVAPEGEDVPPPNNDGRWNPLPVKTGGTIVENSNFFQDGVGKDVNNMIAGYYLLSYMPPSATFDPDRFGKEVYHRVQVKVKRRGAKVHTREGFYGRTENYSVFAETTKEPLQDAIFSPFLHSEVSVNMSAGYSRDDKAGYIVRLWAHLDPKDVDISDTEDGGAEIKIDVACMTIAADGDIPDSRHSQYTFNVEPENKAETIAWVRKNGVKFLMLLPVKKPGSYTVRFAVHDMKSGKLGSAYQFVEIPDLSKKKMALSDIFMITSDETLVWMRSDVTKELSQGAFFVVMRKDDSRSPALRTYMPGDSLQALTMIYNADPKAIARSEIKIQSVLYKDGEEFTRGEPRPVMTDNLDSLDGIPVLQKLTLGSDLKPGDYILQLRVIDKKDEENKNDNRQKGLFSKIMGSYMGEPINYSEIIPEGRTSQALSFRIIENPGQ